MPKSFIWYLLLRDFLLEKVTVTWPGNLKELKGERCPCIQLYLLFFFLKTSDHSPKQFGEEAPSLNDSFPMLLLWDFMEDLGFHFSVVSYSCFSHPHMISTPIPYTHTYTPICHSIPSNVLNPSPTKTPQSGLNLPRSSKFYLLCNWFPVSGVQ